MGCHGLNNNTSGTSCPFGPMVYNFPQLINDSSQLLSLEVSNYSAIALSPLSLPTELHCTAFLEFCNNAEMMQ